MKSIVVVNGSPRDENSNTMTLVRDFIGLVRDRYADVYFEIITLQKKNFAFCRGCGACKRNGDCVFKDDLAEVKQKILKSDLLVLASPVYQYHISAQMKTFFDRISMWSHLMKLLGKPVVTAVTAAGADGIGPAEKYLRAMTLGMGGIIAGNLRALTRSYDFAAEKGHYKNICGPLAHKAADILRGTVLLKPAWLNQAYFGIIRRRILKDRDRFDYEYTYWKGKDWLNASYNQALDREKSHRPADSHH